MKKTNIITASFVFLLAVIFTSCSTSVEIAKRQFNNGYYVHVTSSKHQAETVSAAKKAEPVVAEISAAIVPVAVQDNSVVPAKEELTSNAGSFSSSVEHKQPVTVRKKHRDSVVAPADVTATENNTLDSKKQMRAQRRVGRLANHMLRGDAPGIVLILLCIFLPFLAVGIVDDWGSKFWIDVLLCLLFWIPGIIYAFIVCFS